MGKTFQFSGIFVSYHSGWFLNTNTGLYYLMMKTTKTLKTITFLATLLVASMMILTVSAQSDDFELPDASSVPGNAFYGFERFIEDNFEVPWARLMQGQRGEALKRMQLAEERLAEMRVICNRTDAETLAALQSRYDAQVSSAQALMNGSDTEQLEQQMGERLMNHVGVLTQLRQRAPEEARLGLDMALQSSVEGFNRQMDQMAYRLRQMDDDSPEAAVLQEECETWMNQTRGMIEGWETVRRQKPPMGGDVDIEMPVDLLDFRSKIKRGRN